MYNFEFHTPATLDEATNSLESADDPKILAGGQTLIPTMKQRLAMPSDLVSVSDLPELQGIDDDGANLVIGAGEKHATVASSTTVENAIPALSYLAGLIGDRLVRHMGTLGGSVANNDPSADYPSAVLALNATIHTNKRTINADDFFAGMFETVLDEKEIITKISFPKPKRAGYAKFPNPASRYAMVGVFVAETSGGIRVAVTGAGPCVFRASAIEAALSSAFSPESVPAEAVPAEDLISDMHASAEYRAALITSIAKRAVTAAM